MAEQDVTTIHLHDSRGECEAHLLDSGADLSAQSRMSSIMGRPYDVCSFNDHISTAFRQDYPNCFTPEALATLNRVGWVYCLARYSGEIVYVGMTTRRLPDRMYQHYNNTESPMFKRASALRKHYEWIFGWNVGDSAARLEKAAILVFQPCLNVKDIV